MRNAEAIELKEVNNNPESYYTEPVNQFGGTQCVSDILAGRISITDVPPEFRQYVEKTDG